MPTDSTAIVVPAFIEEYALVWFCLACVFFTAFVVTLLLCIKCLKYWKYHAADGNLSKQAILFAKKSDQAEVGNTNVKQLKNKVSQKATKRDSKRDKDEPLEGEAKGKDKFQVPVGEKVVDRRDPNYRSLKGITNDVFDDKVGADKEKAVAKTPRNDYETLDNIEKEEKATIVKDEIKKTKFRPPDKVVKVASKDPQYETLAGIDEQLFNKEGAGSRKLAGDSLEKEKTAAADEEEQHEEEPQRKKVPFKRPEMVKVSAKNPQYETFADVADDIFKGKK